MPALVIIVDEYAELADEAPEAMSDTDSIARLGRAVAVTLVAATQRPTQKAMGQGAVRSQMDTRICFRVRERKDVDLVLGQGMLNAGWHAHTLNAPGKFLVSAPEHATPKRARAYLVTDDDVARIGAYYGPRRPQLDDVSRGALNLGPAVAEPVPWYLKNAPRVADEPGDTPGSDDSNSLEDVLWEALCNRPEDGADVAELMRATGLGRLDRLPVPRPARRARAALSRSAGAAGAQPGREMRATMSNCLSQLSLSLPRACLHVNAQRQTGRQTQRQVIHRFIHRSWCSRGASNV